MFATAMITEHPQNLTITLGNNATFHCASNTFVYWIITHGSTNDLLDSSNYDDDEKLEKIGIQITSSGSPPSVTSSAFVPGVGINNNTVLFCRERPPFDYSNEGSLLILGGCLFNHVIRFSLYI